MLDKDELTQIEKDKINIGFSFDFRKVAELPLEELSANEVALWKWSGVYKQRQDGAFMVRLRLPGGLMTSSQLFCAADLAEKYGQDILCLTTRQDLQLHWVRHQDIYKVLEGMLAVGITTRNGCGDVTRNVTSCPLAGVCPHEQADTLGLLHLIADDPEIRDEQRNLPRKHKINVAGCDRACALTRINCQGWHPTVFRGRRGWRLYAGGGLGARPYLGVIIFDWVPQDLVLDVVRAVTEVYRRLGDRKNRSQARLKFVVNRLGASHFAAEVLLELKNRNVKGIENILVAQTNEVRVPESFLQGQDVILQRQKDLNTVRVMIKGSEITSAEARRFAWLAAEYGDGNIVFTHRQNLLFRNVHSVNVTKMLELLADREHLSGSLEHLPDMIACMGTKVCVWALSDTQALYASLMKEFSDDVSFWKDVGPLRLNINGCPNACGQHVVADIGLKGVRKKNGAILEEGYDISVGGDLSGAGRLAQHVCYVPSAQVAGTLRLVLTFYLRERKSLAEFFNAFIGRIDIQTLKDAVKGLAPLEEQ